MGHVAIGSRALLLAIFAVSALSKLRGRAALHDFAGSLARLRLLPTGWAGPVAVLLGGAEALIAVLLATPWRDTVRTGMGLAAVLLLVLTAGVLLALRRGGSVPCRCFGASSAPLGRRHVLRNLLLVGAAVAGLAGTAGVTGAGIPPGLTAGDILLAAGVGVLVAVVVLTLDDLVELFAAPARR